jgi:hypothetical protein
MWLARFLLGRLARLVLLEARLHRLLGHFRTDLLAQQGALQGVILGGLHLPGDRRVLLKTLLLRLDHQSASVDQLVEQHRKQHLRRHAAHVVGQALRGGLQVAQIDRLAIDLGDHRIGGRRRCPRGRRGGRWGSRRRSRRGRLGPGRGGAEGGEQDRDGQKRRRTPQGRAQTQHYNLSAMKGR